MRLVTKRRHVICKRKFVKRIRSIGLADVDGAIIQT
jgi:hypothetical protein